MKFHPMIPLYQQCPLFSKTSHPCQLTFQPATSPSPQPPLSNPLTHYSRSPSPSPHSQPPEPPPQTSQSHFPSANTRKPKTTSSLPHTTPSHTPPPSSPSRPTA